MSPKFLNMHQGTVAYKVVVFRINKTESRFVGNPEDRFSRVEAHILDCMPGLLEIKRFQYHLTITFVICRYLQNL